MPAHPPGIDTPSRGVKPQFRAGAVGSVSPVRLGVVILPEFRWPAAGDVWRRAEDLGFQLDDAATVQDQGDSGTADPPQEPEEVS